MIYSLGVLALFHKPYISAGHPGLVAFVVAITAPAVTAHTPSSGTVWFRKKALLIGINYSMEESSLNTECMELEGPHRDALGMKALLIENYGYREEDIVLMVDLEGVDRMRRPTQKNMMREIRALVRGAQPGDRFVFLFSGHSDQIPCRDHTEDDGFDEVLLPMDFDGKSKHKLIVDNAILDACHSGTLLDLDHYDCNKVYFPWVSLGSRDAKTRHVDVVRRNDTFAPVLQQKTIPAAPLDTLSPLPRSPLSHSPLPALPTPRSPLSPLSPSKTIRHSRSLHHKALKRAEQDPSAEQRALRRRRTTVSVAAWAAVKPAAEVFRQIIPAALCMSPVSYRKCDGECPVGAAAGVPRVISLAACGDSQYTWEYKRGQSMTQDLIQELKENPQPKLHDLVTKLGYSRYDVSRLLHGAAKRQREAIKKGAQLPYLLEGVNFQDIQLGSQERLDMEMPFEF
ncbi:caspase domain-containing protein [Fomitopsis serialis]|uniref:caspase domain-containing protein n=1 Tax=Fomitopsis serialis TaxID=139415 RepID=UPI002007378B|nr:caspase domain-containing protein [Neoantrodia serialis]KAH9932852.1 caspase domain-containing protein [Neoantrodia serialis]